MSRQPERFRTPPTPHPADFGTRELLALREIVHAFLTIERPEDVYRFALERVSPLVGATFACVYLIDGSSEVMRLAASYNWPERYAKFLDQMRVRVGAGPSGKAAAERRPIEVLDVFADPSLDDWREVANELGFRSFVALPLQTAKSTVGAITFYFSSPKSIATSESRHLLRTVADQMAATAEKAQLISDLRESNAVILASNVELERQNVHCDRRAKSSTRPPNPRWPDPEALAPAVGPYHLGMPKWSQASSEAMGQQPARGEVFLPYGKAISKPRLCLTGLRQKDE